METLVCDFLKTVLHVLTGIALIGLLYLIVGMCVKDRVGIEFIVQCGGPELPGVGWSGFSLSSQ
jgi:hypothetical protein